MTSISLHNMGWEKTENGLEPIWSCRPILPLSLVDLVEKTVEEIDEDDPDLKLIAIYFMMMKYTVRTLCISVNHSLHVFLMLF